MIFVYLILIVFAIWLSIMGIMLMVAGVKLLKEHQPDSMDIPFGISFVALGIIIILIGLVLVF